LWSTYIAQIRLYCLLSCGIAELVELNALNNNSKQQEFNWGSTNDSRFVKAPSSDMMTSTFEKEAHSKHYRKNSSYVEHA